MAVTLGLDIASLQVSRQFNRSTDRVNRVLERLASGQRINSAADDPAGLAIGAALEIETRISNQARRNVNMGVSLLQIADGALSAVRSLVQRQAELAEQASNGAISNEQRAALEQEFQALGQEVRRISETAQFNGIDILKGEMSSRAVETLSGSLVSASIYNMDISGDGRYATYWNLTDSRLEQLDLLTNEITTIATGAFGTFVASASGNTVAFWSNSNLTGEDPSGYGQIYTWNRETGEINQVTDSANSELWNFNALANMAISADGTTLSFVSVTRYNEDGSVNSYVPLSGTIHMYNIESGTFNDLGLSINTYTTYMHLSADGSNIAF